MKPEVTVKKGDFLTIEYDAKVKETGEVFDTTQEETAKRERIYKEGEVYEPKLVVVGEGWVLEELDNNLPSLVLNKTKAIEIPPEKAFGPRDPEKLKMVPLRRLRDKGVTPRLGMHVEYEKKAATVRTVGAGRVQLDFNPPLAGKTLVYEVTARKKLRTRKEKLLALIHRRIPAANIEKFEIDLSKTEATVRVPEEAFYIEGLQVAKRGIAADIQRFFPTVNKMDFIETFRFPGKGKTPKEPKDKKTKPQKKAKAQKPSKT